MREVDELMGDLRSARERLVVQPDDAVAWWCLWRVEMRWPSAQRHLLMRALERLPDVVWRRWRGFDALWPQTLDALAVYYPSLERSAGELAEGIVEWDEQPTEGAVARLKHSLVSLRLELAPAELVLDLAGIEPTDRLIEALDELRAEPPRPRSPWLNLAQASELASNSLRALGAALGRLPDP